MGNFYQRVEYMVSKHGWTMIAGEVSAFGYSIATGVFDVGFAGIKAFVVAVFAGAGSLFIKWLWNKLFKNGKI